MCKLLKSTPYNFLITGKSNPKMLCPIKESADCKNSIPSLILFGPKDTTASPKGLATIHQILSGCNPLASISNTISFILSPKMVDRQALHHL